MNIEPQNDKRPGPRASRLASRLPPSSAFRHENIIRADLWNGPLTIEAASRPLPDGMADAPPEEMT